MFGYKLLGGLVAASVGLLATSLGLDSGLKTGEMTPAYEPTHVTGTDKNTDTCPVCKYGNLPAVQVWVNGEPSGDVTKIAKTLETSMQEANAKELRFKSFVVFRSGEGERIAPKLQQLAQANALKHVALTWLAPDSEAFKAYKINPEATTTIFVYKNRKVQDKFVNLEATDENLKKLDAAIEKMLK